MRVASLLPSATEILFAIGAGPEVVGVTHECDHPEAARWLPALTSSAIDHDGQPCAAIDRHIRGALHGGSSIYRLDETLLARLRPDLVVTQELCEVCAVAYGQVERAVRRLPGEAEVISLEPSSLDDVLATMLALGRRTGHLVEAGMAVAALRARITAVDALPPPGPPPAAGAGGPRPTAGSAARPVVACIEWTDPLMAGGHWVPEMVRRAGGVDPLGREGRRSEYVEWDRVVAVQPDVMLLMPCGFGLAETLARAAEVTGREGFADLPCARSGRVVAVDGSGYFNRPGPRIVAGLEIVAAALRAEPGDQLPEGAAWVAGG
ncbi:MAG TPA: cobalamin-binding protein [Candidatus Dormibacteraeota bacterium]|jgi:iron complex transport system substrate-binding protein|nr:cobalamin-binding protein [Candidatus Dormibacteraeota bacterium]